MKKFIPTLFLLFLISQYCISQEKVVIGVSSPFLKSQEVNAVFYHSQFIFELLSNSTSDKYTFEAINSEAVDDENTYMQYCIDEAQRNKYDYLLYSDVYIIKDNLYFKVTLKNPYTDVILFVKLFTEKNDFYVNEYLTQNSDYIVDKINKLEIPRVKNKKLKTKPVVKEEPVYEVPEIFRHEFFVANGFLKNHPATMSMFSWYTGYGFMPFNYFNIEGAFFWGAANFENEFNIRSDLFSNFFMGTYFSFHLFLPGVVEPGIGIRLETGYLFDKRAYLSLPIELCIKVYMTKRNVLRIYGTFQYTYYNLNDLVWENNFIIGFMIGYGWKI